MLELAYEKKKTISTLNPHQIQSSNNSKLQTQLSGLSIPQFYHSKVLHMLEPTAWTILMKTNIFYSQCRYKFGGGNFTLLYKFRGDDLVLLLLIGSNLILWKTTSISTKVWIRRWLAICSMVWLTDASISFWKLFPR